MYFLSRLSEENLAVETFCSQGGQLIFSFKVETLSWQLKVGNMDEVTKKWGNLSLTKREVIEHDLQDTPRVEGAAIVAKFFTKRRVNLGVVANTLKSAWRTDLSFEFRDLGENKAVVYI